MAPALGHWHLVRTSLFSSPSPGWRPPDLAAAPQLEPEAGMGVMITRGMFGQDDGQIQWYGIIATTNMSRESWARRGWETLAIAWHGMGRGGEGPDMDR